MLGGADRERRPAARDRPAAGRDDDQRLHAPRRRRGRARSSCTCTPAPKSWVASIGRAADRCVDGVRGAGIAAAGAAGGGRVEGWTAAERAPTTSRGPGAARSPAACDVAEVVDCARPACARGHDLQQRRRQLRGWLHRFHRYRGLRHASRTHCADLGRDGLRRAGGDRRRDARSPSARSSASRVTAISS